LIRRDYILRMLAEFFEVLARIRSLQKGQRWEEADKLTNQEFQRVLGLDADALVGLSDTELLARLIRSESTLAVREKTLIVATLLKEAGDIADARHFEEQSEAYHFKGLHLLLGVLAHEDISDCPELVPRVECFLGVLERNRLPLGTQALLMQHYERVGEFSKAEDTLFSMIEAAPGQRELIDFGVRFYQRLQAQSDDALLLGNLPRAELDSGLAELKSDQPDIST
jgi:hypothetical protein